MTQIYSMLFPYDIISLNANGLRNNQKRSKIFNQLRNKGQIVALQETHSKPGDERFWSNALGCGEMWFSHGSPSARGVALFISNKIDIYLFLLYLLEYVSNRLLTAVERLTLQKAGQQEEEQEALGKSSIQDATK